MRIIETEWKEPRGVRINIPFFFLVHLERGDSLQKICKKVGITRSNGSNTIKLLESRRLVTTYTEGREKKVVLTNRGEKLKQEFINLLNSYDQIENG